MNGSGCNSVPPRKAAAFYSHGSEILEGFEGWIVEQSPRLVCVVEEHAV